MVSAVKRRTGFKSVIDRDDLVPGKVFFSVWYPVANRDIPMIETYIYVGNNLLADVSKETWYFQKADSYLAKGHFPDIQKRDWKDVLAVDADGAPVMFNIHELIERLQNYSDPAYQ